MKSLPKSTRVRIFSAILFVSVVLLGTSYGLVQQSTRLAADDSPLQTAQMIKHELEGGASPSAVVPTIKTSSKTDSTVFAIVTDNTPKVLATSLVDEESTLPPKGTFDYTAQHGTDHFTWQTATGARLATRMLTYDSGATKGYVITGQSLAQAEHRVSIYGLFSLVALVVILAGSFLILWYPL